MKGLNMKKRFAGEVAIITGGSSGIGRATCIAFAQEGAKIVNADIDMRGGKETERMIHDFDCENEFIKTDISNRQEVHAMMKRVLDLHGNVDILVNNAMRRSGDDILDIDEETWNRNIAVVLNGVFLCSKAVLPSMISRKKGVIINISSVNSLNAYGYAFPYSAAKAAVNNLTQNMALRYGKYNIRVNAICPGTVRTPIYDNTLEDDPNYFKHMSEVIPLGRVGEPEDIAKSVLFLSSADASWITGHLLVVDGGVSIGVDGPKLMSLIYGSSMH
jgi:NAD(P)-dependent dehydrogenase (short-subunit alcohol dehydrogenase family)